MAPSRRASARRRARIAALVSLVGALVGAVGIATGAQATPVVRTAAATAVSDITLGALAFDGAGGDTTSTVGNGGSLVLSGGYQVRWWGHEATPRLSLQRRIGSGRWTTTAARVSVTVHGVVVRTPAFSTTAAKQTVSYRLRSAAYTTATTRVSANSVSHVVRVVTENQHRYTGLARTVYRAVQAYCPATAVHVGALSAGAGDYRTGALVIRVSTAVRSYLPIDVRAVALHECSHERQWLDYGGTTAGWEAMKADAAKVFADWTKPAGARTSYPYEQPDAAITPVEHGADCGAQSVDPGGYLGYGGYCTTAELAAGRRLLHGHRY
ncbi:MAG: hypothetical protein HIU86_09210 [Acidobacteria bacterium]|nr:hypothetical protein [Acidobacteriota bacterium]